MRNPNIPGLEYVTSSISGGEASYAYDLWGIPSLVSDTTQRGAGSANKLLFVGYLYDDLLGTYALGVRHYDPVVCRFVEPDGFNYLDPSSVDGLNPFAYCAGDPFTYVDPTGNSVILYLLTSVAIGAFFGIIGGTAQALESDFKDNNSIDGSIGLRRYFGNIVGGMIGGAALGFAGGAGTLWLGPVLSGVGSGAVALWGLTASAGVSFAGGFLDYSVNKWISGDSWDLETALVRGGLTAVEGILAYGTSAVASLFSWEGGKTIHIGPKTINLPEAIGRRFISSIFYDPTGLIIDFIMEKFYE